MKHFHEINKAFWNFVHKYDTNDIGIQKKFIHTFVVANNCYDIACNLGLDEDETEFCYIMGICHDLGRFEQWTLYHTYNDKISENHGEIGKRILLEQFTPEDFYLSEEKFNLLAETILYHIKVYQGSDKTLLKYLPMIHSADAYANVLTVAQGNHIIGEYGDGYSQEMLDKVYRFEKVFNMPIKSKLDRLLLSIGNVFCLSYDYMRKDVIAKGYLDAIYTTYHKHLLPEEQIIFKDVVEHIKKNFK